MEFTQDISTICNAGEYQHITVLNSGKDPMLRELFIHTQAHITFIEDRVDALHEAMHMEYLCRGTQLSSHIPFHEALQGILPIEADMIYLNILYQPSMTWNVHAIHIAAKTLVPHGIFLAKGPKSAGILSVTKDMEKVFGNIQTLSIKRGNRLVQAKQDIESNNESITTDNLAWALFAQGSLDEGTRLLLEVMEVRPHESALDLGCGAGYIGIHIAKQIISGTVTMIDASLAAVAASKEASTSLQNVRVLPSDSTHAVKDECFTLVAMNPPFHSGRELSKELSIRFIRDAAHVLDNEGIFYMVANRMLPYKKVLPAYFVDIQEVYGNTRFMVIRAQGRRESGNLH
jgi:16S rRNA (guanine1207-N2)-methyltransferase